METHSTLRRGVGALTLAAMLALGACQQAPGPQTETAAAPPPSMPATIEVFDLLEGKRTVRPDWTAINAEPLGSKGNPVRVYLPPGEYAYLARLTCADGSRPSYHRVGNFGPGPFTTIIDGFEVRRATRTAMIYMDMYHPGYDEIRTVPGFRLGPAR